MKKSSVVGKAIRRAILIGLSPLRRIGVRFPHRLTRHLHFRGIVSVAVSPGHEFRMRSFGHVIENSLYWYGVRGHEPETLLPWLAAAKTAGVVLDIGANTGLFSLAAAAQNPSCRAFAFEPLPRIADIIRENAALNPAFRIEVCQVAVSNEPGVVKIYDPGGDQPGSASLRSDFLECPTDAVDVSAMRIDDIVRDKGLPTVDLIKLDVEGVEELALQGMRETMEKFKPHLFMEFLDDRRELLDEISHLQSIGYHLVGLTAAGPVAMETANAARCERNLLLTTTPEKFLGSTS